MTRRLVFAVALAASLVPCGRLTAAYRSALISQPDAQRYGLTRAWYTQIQMDQAASRVQNVVLHDGTLFVQTDRAMLHALDAETGQSLWAVQIGMPKHPSLVPGVNRHLVAVVNGSTLYVLNRFNGKLLWKSEMEGAPGAGAALSEHRAYVPTVQGLMYSFALDPAKDPLEELGAKKRVSAKEKERLQKKETEAQRAERMEAFRLSQEYSPPLACQSLGAAMVQPIVTRQDEEKSLDYVAWPTDQGYLFVAIVERRENRFTIKYRLKTEAGIAAQPSYLTPDAQIANDSGVIYAASRDGFVHAISEKTGDALWKFPTGEPLVQPAAVVGEDLYVATQPGGMYCLNAKSGAQKWWTPGILQFVAASKQRVYAADKIGQIQILDANSGARLDAIPAITLPIRQLNAETDRMYLATETGLVQCLHEIELTQPLRHGEARQQKAGTTSARQEGLPAASEEVAAEKPAPAKKPASHAPAAGPAKKPAAKKPAVERPPRVPKTPKTKEPRQPRGKAGGKKKGGDGGGFDPGG
jgi:outer membrane protein assembly factor BamB